MRSPVIFSGKPVNETASETFDFISRLAVGETISSASVTATVYSGTDTSPSAILSGSASISGTRVTQKFTGGTLGVTYLVTCAATTSASQVLLLSGYLVIVPANA